MIKAELKSWIERMIEARRGLSDIQETLRQKGYSQTQITEVSKYYDAHKSSENKHNWKLTLEETVLNPSFVVGIILFLTIILLALIPDMIQYVIVVAYASITSFILSLFLNQIFLFMYPESQNQHSFVLAFLIIFISKVLNEVLKNNLLGTVLVALGVAIIISLIVEKGNTQKAIINTLIITAGSFTIDFFITELFKGESFVAYKIYFEKILL